MKTLIAMVAVLVALVSMAEADALDDLTVASVMKTSEQWQAGFFTGIVLILPPMPCRLSGSILKAEVATRYSSGLIAQDEKVHGALATIFSERGCFADQKPKPAGPRL